jgi:hypothetical protein
MQSTLGFAPGPEDFDDLLFDRPVIAMTCPQPGETADDEPETAEP